MKRTIIYLSVALGVLATYSCNNTTKTEEGTTETTTETTTEMQTTATPLNMHVSQLSTDQDYVCGMKVTDEILADTADVNSKLYGFCSQECKAQFVQDPEKFLSKK